MTVFKSAFIATALMMAAPVGLAESAETEQASNATQIIAKVNGMVCDFCARAVTKVFGKEDAVESVDVDLDAGEIRVALKSGATISDERVGELVKKSGYDLVSVLRDTA
ncbi:MAG: heavy-metal-associated domain-containing protein [Pseudomonadota bacterium]